MANQKLSALTAVTFIGNDDELYTNQGGSSKKIIQYLMGMGRSDWGIQPLHNSTSPSVWGTTGTSGFTTTINAKNVVAPASYPYQALARNGNGGVPGPGAQNLGNVAIWNRGQQGIRGHDTTAHVGGFAWWQRFAFTTGVDSDCKFFMGAQTLYSAQTSNPFGAGVEPSSSLTGGFTGILKDSTDTNLQFCTRSASETAAKTDLGVTLASLVNKVCDFYLIAARNGAISVALRNTETNTVYTGSVADGDSHIAPRNTLFYFATGYNNGPTGTVGMVFEYMSTRGVSFVGP